MKKRYTPRLILAAVACGIIGSLAGGWLADHGYFPWSPAFNFVVLLGLAGYAIGPGRKKL
jgi:hypothetical protein